MDITSAEFVVSNSRADMCPQTHLPEYAFIGRSNVGKSSLINMLTKNPKLAMTSATPGKTLLINHFLINKEWYLVDLPGYGYAQRGKKMMEKIQKLIEYYVLEREQMTCLFVLIDSRFHTAAYRALFPPHWSQMRRVRDTASLRRLLAAFPYFSAEPEQPSSGE